MSRPSLRYLNLFNLLPISQRRAVVSVIGVALALTGIGLLWIARRNATREGGNVFVAIWISATLLTPGRLEQLSDRTAQRTDPPCRRCVVPS